jgi:heme oxygenase
MLADRLHKTPAEIRRDFSWEDYLHFMAYIKMQAEAEAEAVAAAKAGG